MHTLINTTIRWFLWTVVLLPVITNAETLRVNCDSDKGLSRISKAINLLQKSGAGGPNTILVSGSCKENVVIQSMDNLTLTAQNRASISDRSQSNADVIDIADSRRVSISGFTISGGANGVVCAGASLCRFSENTVQGSLNYGVIVANSEATLSGDTLQDHAGRGLSIINGGQADADTITVQRNGDGIFLNTRGTLVLSNSTVQGNQNRGIVATTSSTIRLLASVVTANAGDGVRLQQSSQARFDNFAGPNSITNNGGAGVKLFDLSFAFFDVNGVVTGNTGGTDVVCNPQFSTTRGALTNLGGGSTNCVEP